MESESGKMTVKSIREIQPFGSGGGKMRFKHVRHPCAFCQGPGGPLPPALEPEKTAGPLE